VERSGEEGKEVVRTHYWEKKGSKLLIHRRRGDSRGRDHSDVVWDKEGTYSRKETKEKGYDRSPPKPKPGSCLKKKKISNRYKEEKLW